MALSIVNQWNATGSVVDIQQVITPTAGNWLIAIVAWKSQASAVQPAINVTDTTRNVWYLLATRTTQASNTAVFSSAAVLNVQVWACPAVSYAGWDQMRVYTAIQSFAGAGLGSVCVKIVEVAGMGNGFLTVDSVTTATANTVTSLTLTAPDPAGAADCLMVAAAAGDIAYGSYTTTGTGWTQLDNVTTTNPECGLFSAWREATTTGTVTFGLLGGATRLWSGVVVAIRQTGVVPPQPNPNWPKLETQLGLGYGLSTPLSGVWWTTLPQTLLGANTKRGIGYELGAAQAEPTDVTIRNTDGALNPRPSVTAVATAAGTTTTFACSSTDGANISVGDYFKLAHAPLNSNTGFESGTSGWTASGGTLTAIAVGAGHTGKMVPNGTSATVQVLSTPNVAVTPGVTYTATAFVQNDVSRTVNLIVNWYNSSNALLSTATYPIQLAAGAPLTAQMNVVAPAGAAFAAIGATMTGTPPTSNVMYLDGAILQVVNETTIFQVKSLATVGGTTTVTYGMADGTAGGSLGATAAGDVYVGTPVDLYTPYRILGTWGGKRHYVAAGWAERWPQTWTKDGFVGEVTMTGTGALANLGATNPTSLAGEILRRKPYAYWPLSDAQGSATAQNVSGRSTASLVVTTGKNGSAGTNNFGASTQGLTESSFNPPVTSTLFGDPGNGWQQTGISAADLNAWKGTALVAQDTGFPSIANGVTIYFVHYVNSSDSTNVSNSSYNPTVVMVKTTDPTAAGQGAVIKFSWQRTGTDQFMPMVTWWDKSTHAATAVSCNAGNQWAVSGYFISGALTFNQTSWTAYTQSGQVAGSGSCNLVSNFSIIDVAGEADQFLSGLFCPGIFAHVAVFDRILTAAEINTLDTAMQGHQGDEFTSNRVQRKLDTIDMKTGRALSYDGQVVVAAEGTDSSTIADVNNQIGGYEDAVVFEDAGANYQYRPPALYAHQRVTAVLGERADLGEIPYQPGVTADYDATYLKNSIGITNSVINRAAFQEAIAATQYVAADADSAAKYGLRTLARDTRIDDTHSAFGLAYWLLSQYATRAQRISEVSIDPASNPSTFGFCLTVEVGDLVTVMRRPLNAPVMSIPCVVLQVEHATAPGSWKTTLTLAPARSQALILNDSVAGIVGTNVVGLE